MFRDALSGDPAPLRHVGFILDTDGLQLSGQAVVELRSIAAQLRGVDAKANQVLSGPMTQAGLHAQVNSVRRALTQAAAGIERLLA